MNTIKKSMILLKEDYDTLENLVQYKRGLLVAQPVDPGWLLEGLRQASVRTEDDFPADVVRLYSTVVLRDTVGRHLYTYTVVLPGEGDHRKGWVSLLSPIGAALFCARKGDHVCWQPAGVGRAFTILTVKNRRF